MDTPASAANALVTSPPPPCQLIIGQRSATVTYAVSQLQRLFCPHNGCQSCAACRGIRQQNFYGLTWVTPQERYTLEDLAPIKHTVALALEDTQSHCIVIESADLLSAACANSLLKRLEEPPRGYYFILLAQSSDRVLPTIRSRCLVTFLPHLSSESTDPILACLTGESALTASTFTKLLDTTKYNEQTTGELLETLFQAFLGRTKKTLAHSPLADHHEPPCLALIKKVCARPIMPGSSKLILRELFLHTLPPLTPPCSDVKK